MNRPTIWAVVPGAGIGQRLGANRPKQYLSLAGQMVAQRTLTQLTDTGLFSKIIVALAENDHYFSDLPIAHSPHIETVVGGVNRASSVLNGLQALAGRAESNDWVMVHDIARPLITVEALNKLVDAVSGQDVAAILAARVYDTVKQAAIKKTVEATTEKAPPSHSMPVIKTTLDRCQLWLAQTPQMVRYGLLVEALVQAEQQHHEVTDEASAIEFLNRPVLLVENTRQNIKITTTDDLRLAEYYLSNIVDSDEANR